SSDCKPTTASPGCRSAATWPPACCTATPPTARPPPGSPGAWPTRPSASSPARSAPARPSPPGPRWHPWTRPGTPSFTCPTQPSASGASTTPSSPLSAGGRPTALRRRLKLGQLAALDQRIAVRYHMNGMTLEETSSYLRHHLALSGRSDTLFSDDAAALIHQTSRGYPRAVNNIA